MKQGICGVVAIQIIAAFYHVGVPLLYMVVVVPLGFLVSTEKGIHYGHHNITVNGRIQA